MSRRSRRRDGQALIEYAVVVAFIAIISIAAIGYLRNQTNALFVAQGQTLGVPTLSVGSPVAYVPPTTATAIATATVGSQSTVTLPNVTGIIAAAQPTTGSGPDLVIETATVPPTAVAATAIVVPPTVTTLVAATATPTATRTPTVTATAIPPTATATATATPIPTATPTPGSIPLICSILPKFPGCPQAGT